MNNSIAMMFVPGAMNVTPTAGTTINPVTPGIAMAKPWYTTWWGLGLLGVGAVLAYKKFKS